MRKHCFYCWNDATHVWHDATHSSDLTGSSGLEVCREHAPENAPILLQRFVATEDDS
jgi:hypothetical protein